jgi:type I restriction enzyme M protein
MQAAPQYGFFEVDNNTVEYQADGELRDFENVALDPSRTVKASKRDAKDGEIGIVGYEIPFNRHFYQYQPPRPLEEIDADLDAVSAEIKALLREVHS